MWAGAFSSHARACHLVCRTGRCLKLKPCRKSSKLLPIVKEAQSLNLLPLGLSIACGASDKPVIQIYNAL